MPVIISNASPLIALSSIERLGILKKLWQKITIPEAVFTEVVEKGEGKPGADLVAAACDDWIKVVAVKNIAEVKTLRAVLDEGEAEVIALGQQLKAKLLLLDNREPRLFASAANLKLIGTLGIIKLAWKKGIIEDPLNDLHNLRVHGFYIAENLFEKIRSEFEDLKV